MNKYVVYEDAALADRGYYLDDDVQKKLKNKIKTSEFIASQVPYTINDESDIAEFNVKAFDTLEEANRYFSEKYPPLNISSPDALDDAKLALIQLAEVDDETGNIMVWIQIERYQSCKAAFKQKDKGNGK